MRVDPLTEDGTIDVAFFGSDEYGDYVQKLRWYLKQEGFNGLEEQIVIKFLDHAWLIRPTYGD